MKSRRVVLKKKKDNTIEVNSVVPLSMLESEDYNLLSSDYKKLKDNFSCPVDNWSCKPANLWWCPFIISKEMYPYLFGSFTERKLEEITRKIWDLSITKNIKQLKVTKMIKDFSSFENLLKLKKVIPNIAVAFDYKYEKTGNLYPCWRFKINAKAVTCVFKGREWNFEQIRNWDTSHDWAFSDIKPIKNSSYAILKMSYFNWSNLDLKERSWVDDWRKPYIEELKKNTETNDDFFIIADLNNLTMYLFSNGVEYYSSFLKYFKHINILILLDDIRNKELNEFFNSLPKQYHYELRPYYYKDTKYDFLNLIDSRFENLSIRYRGFPYGIKIKRINSTSNELVSKWSITTINEIKRWMIKTDSEYLKELLFTM